MTSFLRNCALRVFIVSICLVTLTACDDDEKEQARQAEAQRQAQLQAQLEAEQAQRLVAERAARSAEESRTAWIIGIGGGACVACVVVGLLGIHIGVRSWERHRKEHPHA